MTPAKKKHKLRGVLLEQQLRCVHAMIRVMAKLTILSNSCTACKVSLNLRKGLFARNAGPAPMRVTAIIASTNEIEREGYLCSAGSPDDDLLRFAW
jgi:hypothetical protein